MTSAPTTTLPPSLANMQTAATAEDDVLITGVEVGAEEMEVDTSAAHG